MANEGSGYWEQTRRPLTCLIFLTPLLVLYELGVLWLGRGQGPMLRSGADAWMRLALQQVGLNPAYVLPVALLIIFLVWQAWSREPWHLSGEVLLGMVAESLALALALVVIARLQDLAFQRLESSRIVAAVWQGSEQWAGALAYLGAGIYEETLFRLLLLPLIYYGLTFLKIPSVVATTVAITGSGLAFSVAHYVGPVAEPFIWFGFIFRWLAGLFFAAVFVLRGFGVTVGAHAAYDIMVGVLHFQL